MYIIQNMLLCALLISQTTTVFTGDNDHIVTKRFRSSSPPSANKKSRTESADLLNDQNSHNIASKEQDADIKTINDSSLTETNTPLESLLTEASSLNNETACTMSSASFRLLLLKDCSRNFNGLWDYKNSYSDCPTEARIFTLSKKDSGIEQSKTEISQFLEQHLSPLDVLRYAVLTNNNVLAKNILEKKPFASNSTRISRKTIIDFLSITTNHNTSSLDELLKQQLSPYEILLYAAFKNNKKLAIDTLNDNPATLNNLDEYQEKNITPLHIAVKKGNIDLINLYIAHLKIDKNSVNDILADANGNTPLHCCYEEKFFNENTMLTAAALIAVGFSLDTPNNAGLTPSAMKKSLQEETYAVSLVKDTASMLIPKAGPQEESDLAYLDGLIVFRNGDKQMFISNNYAPHRIIPCATSTTCTEQQTSSANLLETYNQKYLIAAWNKITGYEIPKALHADPHVLLCIACALGDIQRLQLIIKSGRIAIADFFKKNTQNIGLDGSSPLHIAVNYWQPTVLQYLITSLAQASQEDPTIIDSLIAEEENLVYLASKADIFTLYKETMEFPTPTSFPHSGEISDKDRLLAKISWHDIATLTALKNIGFTIDEHAIDKEWLSFINSYNSQQKKTVYLLDLPWKQK